jgi:bud emergence protein 1
VSLDASRRKFKADLFGRLYAVVQYDFAAERPDELDAKAGEPIIVIAQSNHEWYVSVVWYRGLGLTIRRFVAKPIGRLGGPGLIPVSFVEIRDPVTSRPIDNVAQILAQGQVQRIEEWKSATARYKENSIPLGSLGDFRNVGTTAPVEVAGAEPATTANPVLSNGDIISTHVMSFHYEANAYWFRINALFLPDDPQAPALSLVLYRLYEDFYNFQITLLDLFPREAGRTTRASDVSGAGRRNSGYQGTGRILPYMPGPCDRVDVDITNERRKDLDLYLYELLELRAQGAGYILRHEHVLGFFTPGSGDMTDTIGYCRVAQSWIVDATVEYVGERSWFRGQRAVVWDAS